MKKLLILIFPLLLIGCQESGESMQSDSSEEVKIAPPKVLSKKALNEFQKMFGNISFDGVKYEFTSVQVYQPNFNWKILTEKDTLTYSYFLLKADSIDLKIAVNNGSCFASILSEHRGYDYPNQFSIHPNDFNWLNNEGLNRVYNCVNTDVATFRDVSFDKRLIGSWSVDSTYANEKENPITKFEFSDSIVRLNDSLEYNFEHIGYYLYCDNPDEFIWKVFIGDEKAIFYSNLGTEMTAFYCTKKK